MFDERYNRMVEGVEPSDALVRQTIQATKPRKVQAGFWKPVMVCVLCVMMVAGAALWRVVHTTSEPHDLIASSNPDEASPVSPVLSNELKLSVIDLAWVDASTLSFTLSIQGDKIDSLTEYDWDVEGIWTDGASCHIMERTEDQPDNEQRIWISQRINMEFQKTLPETITLHVTRYTSGNTFTEEIHNINWADYDRPIVRTGEPIIPLGGGLSISGIGFNEDGWPTIQVRKPASAAEPTHCYPHLDHKTDPTKRMGTNPWQINQYDEGDYVYYNTAVCIPREELDDYQLTTHTKVVGETISGDWTLTIAIPPR